MIMISLWVLVMGCDVVSVVVSVREGVWHVFKSCLVGIWKLEGRWVEWVCADT